MPKLTLFIFLITAKIVFAQKCPDIKSEVDKFTGIIKYATYSNSKINYYKYINNSDTSYYLALEAAGSILSVGEKGVFILLENGEKIEYSDCDIDVESTSNGWEYSAFIKLGIYNISLLKKFCITDYRLYIYDTSLNKKQGEKMRYLFKCLATP